MKTELEKKLFDRYPKIFVQRKLPMYQTCMCWGISTGDGWYDLIESICSVIENYMNNEKDRAKFEKRDPCPYIEAIQVKEKFGGLRFYTDYSTGEISGAVSMAERMSYKICERCGGTDNVTQTKGWIITLCQKCMREHHEKNKEQTKQKT